jgi:hypothetical protein
MSSDPFSVYGIPAVSRDGVTRQKDVSPSRVFRDGITMTTLRRGRPVHGDWVFQGREGSRPPRCCQVLSRWSSRLPGSGHRQVHGPPEGRCIPVVLHEESSRCKAHVGVVSSRPLQGPLLPETKCSGHPDTPVPRRGQAPMPGMDCAWPWKGSTCSVVSSGATRRGKPNFPLLGPDGLHSSTLSGRVAPT